MFPANLYCFTNLFFLALQWGLPSFWPNSNSTTIPLKVILLLESVLIDNYLISTSRHQPLELCPKPSLMWLFLTWCRLLAPNSLSFWNIYDMVSEILRIRGLGFKSPACICIPNPFYIMLFHKCFCSSTCNAWLHVRDSVTWLRMRTCVSTSEEGG